MDLAEAKRETKILSSLSAFFQRVSYLPLRPTIIRFSKINNVFALVLIC